MSCDVFSSQAAKDLLRGKTVYLFGDSNTRAVYKDILWLLEDGRLIPESKLKTKNELSHANDTRLSNGTLHNGCNYKEERLYEEDCYIRFTFLTRLNPLCFMNTFKDAKTAPDIIIINSCVWDLTRWGFNGVQEFKKNVKDTFVYLNENFSSSRVIWTTTLPVSFESQGGFYTKEISFLRGTLPWHILFANKYVSELVKVFEFDILDLNYNFRFLLNYQYVDGIHWAPEVVRHISNLLLTHITLAWNSGLPGEYLVDKHFVKSTQLVYKNINLNLKENDSCTNKKFDFNNRTSINNNFIKNWHEDYFINNLDDEPSINSNNSNNRSCNSQNFVSKALSQRRYLQNKRTTYRQGRITKRNKRY